MSRTREQPWCPGCHSWKWSWEHDDGVCDDCGMVLESDWPFLGRLKYRAAQAVIYGVLGGLVLGPPALIITRVLEGGPLLVRDTVTKTVTVTEYHGVLFDVSGLFAIWVSILLIIAMAAIGPRRV